MTTTIPLEPLDAIHITTLVDNYSNAVMQDAGPAKRVGLASMGTIPTVEAAYLDRPEPDAPLAEHGFSALVNFTKNGTDHRVLFDAGLTPNGLAENARRLDIDLKDVETVVLSHGHFDHTTGLDGFVKTVGRANLPVVIHPEFWSQRRIAIPGRDPFQLPSTSKSALQGAGFQIVEDTRPSFLLENSLLVTGEVDRTTDFEQGFPIHQALRDGDWQPDPLILDDQALIAHVRDKGLVILTGCGHAGAVNIVRYAKKLTGVDDVYAVIGGFHLEGPLFEPIISQTCEALASLAPQFIVPAHCTGWRATHAIAAALPDAFIQNSVGTRFEL